MNVKQLQTLMSALKKITELNAESGRTPEEAHALAVRQMREFADLADEEK